MQQEVIPLIFVVSLAGVTAHSAIEGADSLGRFLGRVLMLQGGLVKPLRKRWELLIASAKERLIYGPIDCEFGIVPRNAFLCGTIVIAGALVLYFRHIGQNGEAVGKPNGDVNAEEVLL